MALAGRLWSALRWAACPRAPGTLVGATSRARSVVAAAERSHADAAFEQFLAVHPPTEADQAEAPQPSPGSDARVVAREERFHFRQAATQLRQELSRGDVAWDADERAFVCRRNPGRTTALLQLPRILPPPEEGQAPDAYLQAISDTKGRTVLGDTLMVLLSADSAALGLWQGDRLARHKVLTGYTVRKSRGGSQLKYLRQGGPGHSVGGQLRRREVGRLFGEAAAKLQEWEADIATCGQAFAAGDVRAWNALYAACGERPPIARADARWRRAGVALRRPRLRELRRLFAALSHGSLRTLAPGPREAG